MGKMGDTWRGVETITKTGETDQGVTVPPPGVHTWLTGMPALEILDEAWVQDVLGGDPATLLWVITLPVNLEPPAPRSNLQDTPHSVRRLAVDETVERGGPGNRRQRAVRHGCNSGHMKR